MSTSMGFRFATSVYGTLTGEGGDIIIADDPINALQANSQNFRNKVKEWFFTHNVQKYLSLSSGFAFCC